MPKSKGRGKRNAHRRAIAEAERETGPDTSLVLYRWPDGWTIRRLMTHEDAYREGVLVHNCCSWYGPLVEPGTVGSLRTPDNFPVTTFRFVPPEIRNPPYDREGWVGAIGGHGDSRPVKDEYAMRLVAWTRTLAYPVEIDVTNGAFSERMARAAGVHEQAQAAELGRQLEAQVRRQREAEFGRIM